MRLPLDQARRDRAAGLKTAGYISGYRGSPLGVYDSALWGAQKLLDQHQVVFRPGLNEELAVSAIRGTQQLPWFGKPEFQGVFGLWYGKGIGVDRACESLKLGKGEADATISSETLSAAFEGNATHVFLKGATKKNITLTVARHGAMKIPEHGEKAHVHYDPGYGTVLPEGKMARE